MIALIIVKYVFMTRWGGGRGVGKEPYLQYQQLLIQN